MADVPEERLSAEREQQIRQDVADHGTSLRSNWPSCPLCTNAQLLAEIDALRSTIDDLTAERDAAIGHSRAVDEDLASIRRKCIEAGLSERTEALGDDAPEVWMVHDLIERAAVDTPKLQATNEQLGQAAFDAVATIERGIRSREWHAEVLCAVGGLVRAAAFAEEPEGPQPEAAWSCSGCSSPQCPDCSDGPPMPGDERYHRPPAAPEATSPPSDGYFYGAMSLGPEATTPGDER